MNQLQIDPELKALIQPLTKDEYKELEESIIAEGCRDSLIVWGETLIDGHNRYSICQKHNIQFATTEKEFNSKDDVKIWMIKNQFGRRNLAPYQRAELALELKPLISAKAKEKQSEAGGAVPQKSAKPPIETRDELAKLAGVSHDTIEKASYIKNNATEEQIERVRDGGKGNSINAVYTELKVAKSIESGKTHIVCSKCSENKPIQEFEPGRSTCKSCRNLRKHVSSNTSSIDKIAAEMRDTSRVMTYEISDMEEEMNSLIDYFIRNTNSCMDEHKALLGNAENNKKIMAILSRAELAIKEMKGLSK